MGLKLSKLIELIGDEHNELVSARAVHHGRKNKKGVTHLDLTIQTNKISLNELATDGPSSNRAGS